MSELSGLGTYSGDDLDPRTSASTTPTSTSAVKNASTYKLYDTPSGLLKEAHLDELLLYYIYSTPSMVKDQPYVLTSLQVKLFCRI